MDEQVTELNYEWSSITSFSAHFTCIAFLCPPVLAGLLSDLSSNRFRIANQNHNQKNPLEQGPGRRWGSEYYGSTNEPTLLAKCFIIISPVHFIGDI